MILHPLMHKRLMGGRPSLLPRHVWEEAWDLGKAWDLGVFAQKELTAVDMKLHE